MTTDNIKKIAVLVETEDGKTRHLLIKQSNKHLLLQMIGAIEGEIAITEQEAEGIIFKDKQ